MDLKPTASESEEVALRLARMRQLQIDLEEAMASVERHRVDFDRIKREVSALTKAIEERR
jgi:hypothetical protein